MDKSGASEGAAVERRNNKLGRTPLLSPSGGLAGPTGNAHSKLKGTHTHTHTHRLIGEAPVGRATGALIGAQPVCIRPRSRHAPVASRTTGSLEMDDEWA